MFGLVRMAPALALLAMGGCLKPCPEKMLRLEDVVGRYNANADAVPRLWARAEVSVTLDTGELLPYTWRSGDPTCLVVLAKGPGRFGPHDFALIGRETAATELFRLGSSTKQGVYYFWYRFGKRGGAWVGRNELAGAPGVRDLPLDPMQLLSVLTVCPLPDDRTAVPTVLLSMQNEPGDCAYVVSVVERQPVTGHVLLQRELLFRWHDDDPPRVYQVNVLDAAGRRVLTAHLDDYRPIDVSELDDPPAVEPVMPTDIEIVANPVPGLQTPIRKVRLRLSELTAEDIWDRAACYFDPPAGLAPVQVDRDVLKARAAPEGTGP